MSVKQRILIKYVKYARVHRVFANTIVTVTPRVLSYAWLLWAFNFFNFYCLNISCVPYNMF